MNGSPKHDSKFIELLSYVGQIVSSSKDIDTVLYAMVNMVRTMLDIERCSVMLLDPEERVLRMKAATHIPPDEWDSVRVPIGESISGRVARDGRPLLVEDMEQSEFAGMIRRERYGSTSFICVPIIVKARVVGVLNVSNRTDSTRFGRRDLEMMIANAGFLGLSIENARLAADSEMIRSHLENLVESLQSGVMTVDREGKVGLYNCNALRLFGCEAEGIGENPPLDSILPAEILQSVGGLIEDTAEYGVCSRVEHELRLPSADSPVPIEILVSPLTGSGGEIDQILLTITDISLRRELDQLRRLGELETKFLSMISHELRTPLTSIKGATTMLSGNASSGSMPTPDALLKIIRSNTDRLVRIVNDILDVVEIEHRQFHVKRETGDLLPVVESAVHYCEPEAEAKDIRLQPRLLSAFAYFDANRIHQVVCHLIQNAIKFSPRGGTVEIEMEHGTGMLRLRVTDTGKGVSPENQSRVFDRFYQTENPMTRSTGGTGLGLYISRAVVENHDGRLYLERSDDQGSEFVVEIPTEEDAPTNPHGYRLNLNDTETG